MKTFDINGYDMKLFNILAWVCFGLAFFSMLIFLDTGIPIFLLSIPSLIVTGLFLMILQLFVNLLTDIRDALRGNINVIVNDPPVVVKNVDVKPTRPTRTAEEIEADIARMKKDQ